MSNTKSPEFYLGRLEAVFDCYDLPEKRAALVLEMLREIRDDERQRCVDAVLSVWSAVPEDHGPWKRCQNAIHRKIREG